MKITIDIEPKEIAALLESERLTDSKLVDVKEKILGEITNAVGKAIDCQIKPLQEPGTEKLCQARC